MYGVPPALDIFQTKKIVADELDANALACIHCVPVVVRAGFPFALVAE
jgi:hypothetical protein